MLNRSMVGLLLLAGLCGSLFTVFLERVVAPGPALAFIPSRCYPPWGPAIRAGRCHGCGAWRIPYGPGGHRP
jgi:hypothetical protein